MMSLGFSVLYLTVIYCRFTRQNEQDSARPFVRRAVPFNGFNSSSFWNMGRIRVSIRTPKYKLTLSVHFLLARGVRANNVALKRKVAH